MTSSLCGTRAIAIVAAAAPAFSIIQSPFGASGPFTAGLRILRQWTGLCDVSPDYAPIIGVSREVDNFYVDVGWGTYGFKAAPAAAKLLAELIATKKTPKLIEPFSPARFYGGQLVGEKAAAAVSS